MVVCPACGIWIKGKEEECPHCGWQLRMTGKVDCPFCGELIPVASKKCPLCGFDLSEFSAKARSQSIDKIRGLLRAELKDIESSGNGEGMYRCPKCGMLLEGTEQECPECGQILIGKSGLRCPTCAAPVGKRRKKCPICGTALGSIIAEALPMIPYVPEPVVEPTVKPKRTPGSRICPTCGAIVPVEMRICPLCDTDLTGEKPKPKLEVTPRRPEALIEEATPLPQPEITPQVPEPLPERKPEVEAESRTPVTPVEEIIPIPQPEITPPAKETLIERKLEPERVTTIDYGIKPSDRGLSNGVAHVNGRGIVNGTGAVNGRAFVNGTGISNGLRPRSKVSPAQRTRLLTRWQLFAVLVAIIIVIPAFMLLSYSRETDKFSIDGNYAEWDGATTYGIKIPSTAPSSNITEWAVASQMSDLYLYFRTQTSMMSSSNAESFYLFVDSDGSSSTGYVMESIGADYMLQLTGWDNAVNSSSLSRYSSTSDQLNWNAWTSLGSLSYSTDGLRMEARASLSAALGNSARLMLLSKDSMERGAVSYVAPLKGTVLLVEQIPSSVVTLDGLVSKSNSVELLTIRFTSEGGSGRVEQVNPHVGGASMVSQVPPFPLVSGETKDVIITVDTLAADYGQLVSAEVFSSDIVSSYASVEISGSGASAYVGLPPTEITIDGAFADWAGRLSVDLDSIPVANPSVDINEVGNLSTSLSSFFYVSVEGEMCNGTYVPAMVIRPSGSGGGGGGVVIPRHTAEDILRVYVDSDKSNSTGEWVALNSKHIGADQMIEVRGLFGRITSMKEFDYSSSGDWVGIADVVKAAKDAKRIEISVTATSLGGSADIDFIVETTSWKGRSDLATFDASSMRALTNTWIVDSITTSPYATSMSYQRKMFYDGVNYWSFFFDGANTVCKYSLDDGKTWALSGRVFTTSSVNETSIWYDSSTITVYAVGDISVPSTNVFVQTGVVDAAAHKISWASSDSILKASTYAIGGKNTYISKDANGYLWVLSTNWTVKKPLAHGLSAFRSTAVNSPSAWIDTGNVLPFGMWENNSVGSIVPAGSGSDMWAIYAYEGYVCAKKYVGAWPADYDEVVIYKSGTSWANTDNSPPSVTVDGKGVVHVVYGTGREDKFSKRSIPQIFYSHNNTDSIAFTPGLNLDPSNDTRLIANYYPTISLDSATNNLYVLWLQCNSAFEPKTVMGRKDISGTWSAMTIEPQTSYTKQYLTSVYSVSGQYKICWQWTQNTTAPIEVLFDSTWIPEFGDLALPLVGFIIIFAIYRQRSRSKDEPSD